MYSPSNTEAVYYIHHILNSIHICAQTTMPLPVTIKRKIQAQQASQERKTGEEVYNNITCIVYIHVYM